MKQKKTRTRAGLLLGMGKEGGMACRSLWRADTIAGSPKPSSEPTAAMT